MRPGAWGPRRALTSAALLLFLSLLACNVPGCGQQPPVPPGGTPIPATVDPASLPPTNPRIVAQRPYPGEELPLDGSVDLYFDQPMNRTSVEGALSFSPNLTYQTLWVDEATLRVTPDAGTLQRAKRYEVTVGDSAASERGLTLVEPFSAEIQTVGFLEVGEVVPARDAEAVEPDSVITVFFNRPVAPLMIAEDMPGLPQPLTFSPDIPGTGEWVNTSIYLWHPSQPLAGATTYTATVDHGLTDQTGGVMEAPFSWSFTTLPPGVMEVYPADGAIDVRLDDTVKVTFNQPMDHASTEAAFSLVETNQQVAIPGAFEWDEDSRILTFRPSGLLPLDADYIVTVGATAHTATGEATLTAPAQWRFAGVNTLAVRATEPANGAPDAYHYGIAIQFSAPVDEESLEDKVVFDPPLADDEDMTSYFSTYDYRLYVNATLAPSTTYTVTLLPGVADPYGNRIADPYTWSFTTRRLDPLVQFNVDGLFGVYDASRTTELFVLYRNVEDIQFTLGELTLEEFSRLTGPDSYSLLDSFVPSPTQTIRSWTVAAPGEVNEANYLRVPVVSEEGGSLAPGIYILLADANEVSVLRHFMIVSNANLTLKRSFDESLVWLTDLQTGQPLGGVPVTLYDHTLKVLASENTGQNGVLEAATPHANQMWEPQYAVVDNGTVFALAMSDWEAGLSPWEFGIPAAYEFQDTSIYIYTDRPLYRPGQEVFFKGVVRSKDDVTYILPAEQSIDIIVYNDQGEEISRKSLPLSDLGTFNGSLTLDTDAGLGYYSIEAELRGMRFGRGFQVAEYRRPEFQVEVTPASLDVLVGDTVQVTVDAEFFFGGPVSDAEVSYSVLAERYFFAASGLGTYSFADYNLDEGTDDGTVIPGYGEVIEQGTGQTDANGDYVISLPASLDDTNTSRRLTIEAGVTDINGVTVYGRTEIVIHKGQYYVGVRPTAYVGAAGEETSADVLVVDWEGNPIADAPVRVQIVERRWHSIQEEDEHGRTQWTWSVEETPVGDPIGVTTNDIGRATVTYTPPNGGTFKVLATVTDPQGREQSASTFIWVTSTDYISWRQGNNDRIDLVADKDTYVPGETAEILIPSPFQGDDVKALITIERGSILRHEVITLPSNSYVYRLPITGALAPNVYVSVVIVKGVDEANPVPSFRMGMASIQIEPSEQTVTLDVQPDRDKVGPGETVTFTVTATNSTGDPVDAELSLALVDLATLSLAPPNSGPIVEHFYGPQALGVRTAVPLSILVNRRNQTLIDQGKGGGGGGGEGFFDVRTEFRDTAYWTAQIRTGTDGVEAVRVTLPDNLTTWRLDARGVTDATLVGQSTVDVIASKPLLIRPQTPRFFVAEDEATLSAVVNNNTGSAIEATVTLEAQGVTIIGDAEQTVTVPANGRVEVAWPVAVHARADWVNLVFSVEGGGLGDASKPPLGDPDHEQMLPVYRYEAPETVGTAGQIIDAGSRVEGIVLPPTYEVTQGQVTVLVDSSLAATTLGGLTYLRHYPYESTEQVVSSFLPNALTILAFRELSLQNAQLEANLEAQVNIALQKLYAQQHVDGGWGWWVNGPSNSTVTAYVVQGLAAAKEAGFSVDEGVLNEGIGFLKNHLEPLDTLDDHTKLDRQAYILYVLARAGEADASRSVQLFENRQGLQHWARALLAQTLWMIDPQDVRASEIQGDLVTSGIISATGVHWEEDRPDTWNWNTDTRSTAIILDTFARLWPEHELGPNIVRWLMVAREGSHWETTQETAWALIGLTDWMVTTGELRPDYTWSFSFNGAPLANGSATSQTIYESSEITINVADLMTDEVNRLLFERSAGQGRLYYTAHLTAYLPVPEVEPLSRGVIVDRRYLDAEGNPVTEGRVGDILTVQVTVIAPHDLYYVVIEDPLPAGTEAVDTSLLTENITGERPVLRPDDPLTHGWGWWWFSNIDLRDEKLVASAEFLPAGSYQLTYQIRLGMPGTYRVIPTVGWEFYFPEVYGRGGGMLFTILPEE